jgi:benzoyl-CoA reductase/2-hydroxyglutaryl-CoA dehydratase subunit BcrC/BadD/HgdB
MKSDTPIPFDERLEASRLRVVFQYMQMAAAGYKMPQIEKIISRYGKPPGDNSPCVDRSLLFPSEFIYALDCRGQDVIPVTTDMVVAATAIFDPVSINEAFLNSCACGYNATCSFQQIAVGLSMQGKLPPFRAGFLVNEPCIGSLETFNQILGKKQIPVYNLYIPGEYSKEAIEFIKKQFVRMTHQLEKETRGTIRFDIDKLREAIRNSNMARQHFINGLGYMKGKGRLVRGWEFLNFTLFCSGGFGSAQYMEVARAFSTELRQRREHFEKNSNQLPERPRIYQVHFPPYSNLRLVTNIDRQCDLVAADINTIWWDEIQESDPLEGLARKLLVRDGSGFNARERVKTCHRPVLESYDIDGVICFQHMYGTNCPLATETNINLLRTEIQAINRELNKNILLEVIPIDCLRSTNIPANVDTRINAFFETLRQVKGLPPFKIHENLTRISADHHNT